MAKPLVSDPARALATRLREADPVVLLLLDQVLTALGSEVVSALCMEAERIQAAGGELLALPYQRKRTLGGVFFRLAREKVPALWARTRRTEREVAAGRRSPAPSTPAPALPSPASPAPRQVAATVAPAMRSAASPSSPRPATSAPAPEASQPTFDRPGRRFPPSQPVEVIVKRSRARP